MRRTYLMKWMWSVALGVLTCAVACNRSPTGSGPEGAVRKRRPGATPHHLPSAAAVPSPTVRGDDPVIQGIGRTVRGADGLRFAWPATGFRVRFTGTTLVAHVRDDVRQDDAVEPDWLEVSVDGQSREALPLHAGEQVVTLAHGLAAGEHELVVRKRTEPQAGTVMLRRLSIAGAGSWSAPMAAPGGLRIELLGDSITAGYGNECHGPDDQATSREQDALAAYGVLAAQELGAEDVSLIAWSGKGVIRNAVRDEPETLPELWRFTLPVERVPADLAQDRRDVVIVNLGANDFGGNDPSRPPHRAFVDAYVRLLRDVRAARPQALIVLVLPPMIADDYPSPLLRLRSTARVWLQEALHLRLRAHDTEIRLFEQYGPPPEEGYGCSYHPSLASHRRMGRELAAFLRQELDADSD